MLLKNHLIEVFKKASSENDILLKDNIVLRWVHRFGIDSLNDLLVHSPAPREYEHEEENQEQITLIDEVNEEENQEQITLIDEVNQEKIKWESTHFQTSRSNEIVSKNRDSNNTKQYAKTQKSPLPYINNLRKWINNDKKAS